MQIRGALGWVGIIKNSGINRKVVPDLAENVKWRIIRISRKISQESVNVQAAFFAYSVYDAAFELYPAA